MTQTTRLGPWAATIPRDLRYGSISQGSGPPSPPPPPAVFADFIWAFASSGTTPWPISPIGNTNVTAGQYLILCSNYRGTGFSAPIQPPLGGSAVVSAITGLAGIGNYDTLGVSDGSAQFWQATVVTGGLLTVSGPADDFLQWVMILNGSGVAQQARSTADANATANATLVSPPSGQVLSIVNYGGNPGAGGESTGTPPSGWIEVAHVGSQSPNSKYVQIFEGTDQSISYNLGAAAVTNGGRDVFLVEITP